MALRCKLETSIQLESSPEKFLKAWKSEAHQIPKHTPNHIHAVHLHEGDWETHGSIKIWHYSIDGKKETFKEKLQVDDANNRIILTGIDGDVMKMYKVYNAGYKLEPKGQGSLAYLSIEYEKANSNVPAPENYLDFIVKHTKDIDASLVKA